MRDTLVVIPTYNEIDNIEELLRTIFALDGDFHVLVVDDNSPDLTALKVIELIVEFPDQLFLEKREGKLGLGTAYIHGFKWALDRGYEYIFEMDADFSHDPKDLIRLYNACENDGNDVAIGSRYKTGVNVVNWPMSRILLSWVASKYVRFITRMSIHDTTAGYVCYHRRVLEKINLDKIRFVGYAFQIEMKYRALSAGCTVQEVPIIFEERRVGQSKMTTKIVVEAFYRVWKIRFS